MITISDGLEPVLTGGEYNPMSRGSEFSKNFYFNVATEAISTTTPLIHNKIQYNKMPEFGRQCNGESQGMEVPTLLVATQLYVPAFPRLTVLILIDGPVPGEQIIIRDIIMTSSRSSS